MYSKRRTGVYYISSKSKPAILRTAANRRFREAKSVRSGVTKRKLVRARSVGRKTENPREMRFDRVEFDG